MVVGADDRGSARLSLAHDTKRSRRRALRFRSDPLSRIERGSRGVGGPPARTGSPPGLTRADPALQGEVPGGRPRLVGRASARPSLVEPYRRQQRTAPQPSVSHQSAARLSVYRKGLDDPGVHLVASHQHLSGLVSCGETQGAAARKRRHVQGSRQRRRTRPGRGPVRTAPAQGGSSTGKHDRPAQEVVGHRAEELLEWLLWLPFDGRRRTT